MLFRTMILYYRGTAVTEVMFELLKNLLSKYRLALLLFPNLASKGVSNLSL